MDGQEDTRERSVADTPESTVEQKTQTEGFLGLVKFLAMMAATVIVAIVAARLVQALLGALGIGFG